jgi:molybdopterin converting factor small subunit
LTSRRKTVIKVNVKLYGTLPQRFSIYDIHKGLVVELDVGARIMDLTDRLKLTPADGVVVAMDRRVLGGEDVLTDGACVQIFQQVHGG